jgi:glycosyltransferase involved in cell wall biosynthesis
MMSRKIICLTPVKNEAWVLETFLATVSIWADHIIIADQGSTDGSLEIYKKFSKIILINNENKNFNEPERQKILLNEARKIAGENNIFLTLDADEFLVNFEDNPEWEQLKNLNPGDIFMMPWLNVLPKNQTFYPSRGGHMVFGYINDGRKHQGNPIHSPRVPEHPDQKKVFFSNLNVLHYQYASRERLLSKHRWYECYEKIKFPAKNNIDIYRQYHHIDLPIENIESLNDEWLKTYHQHGIDLKAIKDDEQYWWDKEVCLLFDQYGVKHFKKIAIWGVDWKTIYRKYFPEKDANHIYDPRSMMDQWIHEWLANSQNNRFAFHNKVINKLLRLINW